MSCRWKANPYLSRCHFQEGCKTGLSRVERATAISFYQLVIWFLSGMVPLVTPQYHILPMPGQQTVGSTSVTGSPHRLARGMSSIPATKATSFMGPLYQHWGHWRQPGRYPKEKWSCPLGSKDCPLWWALMWNPGMYLLCVHSLKSSHVSLSQTSSSPVFQICSFWALDQPA